MPRAQTDVAKLKIAKKQERKQAAKSNGEVIQMLSQADPKLNWFSSNELGEYMEIDGKTALERMTPFTEPHVRRVTYGDGNVRWVEFPKLLSRRIDEEVAPFEYLFAFINLDTAVPVKPFHIATDEFDSALEVLLEAQSDTRATTKQLKKLESAAETDKAAA